MRSVLMIAVLFLGGYIALTASEPSPPDSTHLTVATREAPPFAYQDAQGQWQGLAITLLKDICHRNGWTFTLVDQQGGSLIDPVTAGTVDAALAAITITPEREQVVDFSHPYHQTGLGIATPIPAADGMDWWLVVRSFFSPGFLGVIVSLSVVLLLVGALIWVVERRKNPEFGGGVVRGLGNGFWFSAVTMTTVGYGDKSPKTPVGRVVTLAWMFTGLIMIASFTAQLTSTLTLSASKQKINGPKDLTGVRVGVMAGTTADTYASEHSLKPERFPSLDAALEALAAGRIGAVIHDQPVLVYACDQHFSERLTVIDAVFARQDYGIALPLHSTRRKAINQTLIEVVTSASWNAELARYGLK